MHVKEQIYDLFYAYQFMNPCRIIEVKYDAANFGDFVVELLSGDTRFQINNDRGQLFVDRYDESQNEWRYTNFFYSRVDLDNLKEGLYAAFDYINQQSDQ